MRKALIAGAILSSLSLIGTAQAANVATVVGTGTISPGLPQSGCAFQTVSFSGTAVAVGTNAGPYNVTFNGNSDICETLGTGHGSGTLSGGVTGSVTYSRTETVVTLSGSVSLGGATENIVAGCCTFAPTSAPPITSYALNCKLVLN